MDWMQWVLPAFVKMMLLGWNRSFVGKKRKEVWRAGPLCIFLMVWKTRNKIAFEDDVLSIQRLKSLFIFFGRRRNCSSKVVLRLQQVSLIGWVLIEGGFFWPHRFSKLFLSHPERGVFLCCIFLSPYFSVSFQYNFFSFTY